MIVIDVDFNTLRKIRFDSSSKFFYIDYPEATEIYTTMNGMLFRFTRAKQGPEKDMLFFSDELKGSLQVQRISMINEAGWQAMFTKMVQLLEKIAGRK